MDFLSPLHVLPPLVYYVPLIVTFSYLAIHYLVYSRRTEQWMKSNIPFLKPSFLIGHKYFLNLYKHSIHVSLDRIYRENSDKDVVGFFIGTKPLVLIRNPALIKQVLVKNFDKTFNMTIADTTHDKVAQNMLTFTSDKSTWQSNRRMLSPIYASSRMSGEAFVKISRQIGSMKAHLEKALHAGRPINMQEVSINFFTDSLSYCILGQEDNSYEKHGLVRQLVGGDISAVRKLAVYALMFFPNGLVSKFLPLMPRERLKIMESFVRHQMEHRDKLEEHEKDFVDLLMKLRNKEGENDHKQESEDTMERMVGFGLSAALAFINVGTTWQELMVTLAASLSSSAIHLLSLHPELQKKIKEEVDEAMTKHQTSEFTFEVVQDLRFLNQCLYETARLLPPSALTRVCSEDFKVPGFDYTFRKGERIIVNPYSMHRDPANFKNPDKFDPERFSSENKKEISPDSFLPFGTGPRKCPAYKLGLVMDATLVASMVHKYEIRPRSHTKQMDAKDLHSLVLGNSSTGEKILVDLVPREIMAQQADEQNFANSLPQIAVG